MNIENFIYTFNDNYFRDYVRKSIKECRVAVLNRYFESKQCEEKLKIIQEVLKLNYNEFSIKVDEYLKYIKNKRDEFKLEFENGEKDYRKMNKKELDRILEKKLGELEISKELQKINQDDLLVSYDFNSSYPRAQID